MDIAQGNIGPEVKYELDFVGGELVAKAQYAGADLQSDVALKFKAEQLVNLMIDKAEQAIPGDQTVFADMLKKFLAGLIK